MAGEDETLPPDEPDAADAPHPVPSHGAGPIVPDYFTDRGSRLVTLRHMSVMEAELARVRLEAESIPCFLIDREMGAYSTVGGGIIPVKLQVHENDAEMAEEILSRPAPPSAEGEYVDEDWRCPKCHRKTVELVPMSPRRKQARNSFVLLVFLPVPLILLQEFGCDFGQVMRWGVLPWIIVLLALALALVHRRKKRCTECGHQWSDKPSDTQ